MIDPLEDTYLRSCPDDICDGSGMLFNEETGQEDACLCMKDPDAVEPSEPDL